MLIVGGCRDTKVPLIALWSPLVLKGFSIVMVSITVAAELMWILCAALRIWLWNMIAHMIYSLGVVSNTQHIKYVNQLPVFVKFTTNNLFNDDNRNSALSSDLDIHFSSQVRFKIYYCTISSFYDRFYQIIWLLPQEIYRHSQGLRIDKWAILVQLLLVYIGSDIKMSDNLVPHSWSNWNRI